MTKESEERRERAERILQAAADLMVRYGYDRVTIDDVAAQAQIGKGTVYLHWKTKEALFGTLFLREMLGLERLLLARLRSDPYEAMPHRLYAGSMLDAYRRPIGWGLLTQDRHMMGKLSQSVLGKGVLAQGLEFRARLFRAWRKKGLLEPDTDPAAQVYAFRATYNGFLEVESHPMKESLSPEAKAAALAQTIRRAFEPKDPPVPEILKEIADTVATELEEFCLILEQQINEQMQS